MIYSPSLPWLSQVRHFLGTLCILFVAAAFLQGPVNAQAPAKKKVFLLAGNPSHAPGDHEHNAGLTLLAKCLAEGAGDRIETEVHLNAAWPEPEVLAKADAIVIYSDGGGGHPALRGSRLGILADQMKRGAGLACLHYAVEVPKDKGGPEFREWLGGYFETHWSVNPHWVADFKSLPKHPITSGVNPFSTNDEWYFHMRFKDGMDGVTPILSAVAPPETMSRKDGPHSGNPAVREEVAAGVPQHVAWAVERADGGRGFGFTGGHYHKGWSNPDQRKLVLNAILWVAKADVPEKGVESTVTESDLLANLDPKTKKK